MKKVLVSFLAGAAMMSFLFQPVAGANKTVNIKLYSYATFYDGYQFEKNPDSLLQDGILRHSTSLYAVRMTDEQLSQIGDSLSLRAYVQACCDNYDRIGNVNLAFVPKGSNSYKPDEVDRIEVGRFITPFMNKNKRPDIVPYTYDVSYLSYVFRDRAIREKYDIWVEFELFGVPYAAQQQVDGCAGRSDVFKGALMLVSSQPAEALTDDDVLVPIVMKRPEYKGGNLNNYTEEGTDTIGRTTKTYTFDVPRDVNDGQLVLVTSNHGANVGGEEYNRRWHYVYVDDRLVLTYKPGRNSCEPYRKYNTQANGIYGYSKMSDDQWQSFSNWCPGDVIDNRIINLGAVKAGLHKVRITVPDAVFADKQGDIPVSLFFQGLATGSFSSINSAVTAEPETKVVVADGKISVVSDSHVMSLELYELQGKLLGRKENSAVMAVPSGVSGVCLVNVELTNGVVETHKVVIK